LGLQTVFIKIKNKKAKIVLTQINSDAIIHFAGQVRNIIQYGLNGKSEKKIKKAVDIDGEI
jgi:hypothetical protein